MAGREPHEVLGVERDASEDEVRAAYREMVKKHHPDVSDAENAEERFVNIRDAYEEMRERADVKNGSREGNGWNGPVAKDTDTGTQEGGEEPRSETRSSTRSEHKKQKREKRKRWDGWDDPWGSETRNGGNGERGDGKKRREGGKERIDRLGYGWTLFSEGEKFSVSKSGGRGSVYIDREGGMSKEKYLFLSRAEAEEAYEEHVRKREEKRDTFSLESGWRIVQRASGYAVEGEIGYLGVDGSPQNKPYWFRSREEAKDVYEAYIQRREEKRKSVTRETNTDSLASRVTVGAALLPFLATVTFLNVLSSSLGLGAKGKNPYLASALTTVFFGTLAVVLRGYYPLLSFILLSLAVWAGVEFTVMVAGPYTADEIEG